jgi:hypothetical protein
LLAERQTTAGEVRAILQNFNFRSRFGFLFHRAEE